ncbi:MAG TPA: DNA polymerase III subunit alpha [Bacteroidales bacterium]|nr:MAG: DNA polymerase III subunit alpha [Bacteroidetes bacterium GWF2_33_38]OFY86752.1 MAG: DNA polymerase III subunit alpha [Bacteroidetes bacterium RIFOXYA2_FULL_33_7]HBF88323.1 DNA polymerase III subunit alpha [Bacteroidales bacterium]
MNNFTHLHVHTQYSILDGLSAIPALVKKAKDNGMTAIAITDHGNMFGVKEFHNTARKNGIKPIVGCETYVAARSRKLMELKEDRSGFHLILLAKNTQGYKNLTKLISYSWIEGFYYRPRIDWELLEKYHEGLIASSACLAGEIPRAIKKNDIQLAETTIERFKSLFGDDFYLEIQRHETNLQGADKTVFEQQKIVNQKILELGKKHNVKVIASNDVHFVNSEDAEAHDRLICLTTNSDFNATDRLRYTKQEWMKSKEEMGVIFADVPEVLENTMEIAAKIEDFELDHAPIMPDFPLPEGFSNEDDYLKHLTYIGAKKHYGDVDDKIKERIDFELDTIKKMGFPGYFLIVWDFLKAAREMGVAVGPGRGSAAGSVVAYCLRITDIDPLKYNLLFERFLNPDRVSMPDIDIDFDDDGREKVLKWVEKKYGHNRVANIITFGTMAAKSSIRDVARIQNLPLNIADKLAKLVPEKAGTSLQDAFKEVPELKEAKNSSNEEISSVLKYAEVLEGSVRHTGVHACGIIIGRDDLIEHIPVATSKDSDLLVTQFDGKHVESVGMLKMDFLGLKTLSIIKDAVENIKIAKGIDIDIETIPLDDKATYELYSKGETTGLFQFESDGMKKHLKDLKPTKFEDLIAMNALYRPGPIEYIPEFIKRKHGKSKIEYDLAEMEEYLADTYGITVYQEQVMLLSQKLAGFTRGEADTLRKAMGKKNRELLDKLKVKFVEGCLKNNHPTEKVEKIWKDWEAFAEYAFNKSHSTCYSLVSYQTGYLKAHYPAEFMSAVLSRNLNDLKKVTFFMDECKRMGVTVLGANVNESFSRFNVNNEGNIRFGLNAIKGVGENAVLNIIEERKKNGAYKSIFDFIERVNLTAVNKRCLEALAASGALDCFKEISRYQYFIEEAQGATFIETLIKYGNKFTEDKSSTQISLFGDVMGVDIVKPEIPKGTEWLNLEKLNKEKDLIGIYLSAHPLDDFKLEISHLTNYILSDLKNNLIPEGKDVVVAGIVTEVKDSTGKNGKPYASITIDDYSDSYKIMLFSNDYVSFKNFFSVGYSLLIKGKVQKKPYGNTEELEFKIIKVSLLSEVRETMFKTIKIKLPINSINAELINKIDALTETNKGKTALNFLIYEPLTNIYIEMFSRTKRVYLSNEIIDFLEKKSDIEFKIL